MAFSLNKLANLCFASTPASGEEASRPTPYSRPVITPRNGNSVSRRSQSNLPEPLQNRASHQSNAAAVEDPEIRNARFQQVVTEHVPLSGISADTIALLKRIKCDLRMPNPDASADADIFRASGLETPFLLHPSNVEIESEADLRNLLEVEPSIRPQITGIELRDFDVTERGLVCLKYFPALRALVLNDCNIGDGGLRAIRNLAQLKSLHIDGCMRISGAGLHYLKDLKQLKELRLEECQGISENGFARLSSLTALETVQLSGCDKLTDKGLSVFENFTRLQSLTLGWCPQLTGEGFSRFKKMEQLKKLNFRGSCNVQNVAAANLRQIKTLRTLGFPETRIGNEGLRNLKDMRQLKFLSLNGAKRVEDAGLEHLRSLSELQKLDLTGTSVTKAGCDQFMESLKGTPIEGLTVDFR